MIEALHIENIAVVKRLDISLADGMTVLSGETGAGKSIIIDSLKLLTGARADRELLRSGESRGEVSALFGRLPEGAKECLAALGFDSSEDSVMLSRSIGTGACARLNGRAIPLSVLREVSATLFNIHGQNDNQQLMDARNHIALLDAYADCAELKRIYREDYDTLTAYRSELAALQRDEREQARLAEMLRYQLADIDAVKLKAGEEEALEEQAKRLRSAEQIERSCAMVEKALCGGEKGRGAVYLAERSAAALLSIADALPEAEPLASRLSDIRYELEDIAATLPTLCSFGGEDVLEKLDRTEARLDAIAKLKRKYGATVAEVLAFRAETAERLARLENAEDRMAELADLVQKSEAQARTSAAALTEKRRAAADGLAQRIAATLAFLDMPKVRFAVSVTPADLHADGADCVEFLIGTNVGEPLMPLAKIASGGELARIMLSLKNVLNECDGIDTVIFDEIDTGISGKTSRKVGIKLSEIGRSAQVLCVTHSAQIASLADHHLYIAKKEEQGRTETTLRELDARGREEEIARILGGIEITEAQRAAAREMIAEGESFR